MDEHGYRVATPELNDPSVHEEPFLDFTSGYVQRALHLFPKQGNKEPWKLRQNYPRDIKTLRFDPVDDGAMVFSREGRRAAAQDDVAVAA
jgi:hypothetical protein